MVAAVDRRPSLASCCAPSRPTRRRSPTCLDAPARTGSPGGDRGALGAGAAAPALATPRRARRASTLADLVPPDAPRRCARSSSTARTRCPRSRTSRSASAGRPRARRPSSSGATTTSRWRGSPGPGYFVVHDGAARRRHRLPRRCRRAHPPSWPRGEAERRRPLALRLQGHGRLPAPRLARRVHRSRDASTARSCENYFVALPRAVRQAADRP